MFIFDQSYMMSEMDKKQKLDQPLQALHKVEKLLGYSTLNKNLNFQNFQFYVILFFTWLYPLCELYELTEMKSIMGSLKPILHFVSGLDTINKYHQLISKKSQVKSLLEMIEEMYWTFFDAQKFHRLEKSLNKLTYILGFSLLFLVALFFIIPLFDHKTLPFGCVFMLQPSNNYFFIVYSIQFLIIFCASATHFLSFTFLISTTAHITMQIEILQQNIIKFGKSENKIKFHEFIINTVEHHNQIIKVVNELNKIISWGFYVENIIASIWCCLNAYYIQNLEEKDSLYFIHLVSFIFALLTPLLMTLCSEGIIQKNNLLFRAICEYPWHEEPPANRKKFLMLMTMARRPLSFNFRGFVVFSLPQYALMLQAAYSYITLLNSIDV